VQTEPGHRESDRPARPGFDVAALRARARTHVPRDAARPADLEGPPEPAPRARRPGVRGAVGAAAAGLLLGGLWAGFGPSGSGLPWPAGATALPADADVRTAGGDWAAVLRDLDRRRARAFDTVDAGSLLEVYAPGSAALAADRGRIAALRARGLHAGGLRLRIDRVSVEDLGPGRVDLVVIDRLAGYTFADRRGVARAHASGRGAESWRVRLVPTLRGSGWLISTVTRATGPRLSQRRADGVGDGGVVEGEARGQ
jgi:hypothetical protein